MSLAKPFNTRPLYQQVADEFISRIVSRRWAPGQSIENETEIARSLGISLGTVRKAFDILAEHALLDRQQGKGTTVADLEAGPMRSRFSNIVDDGGRRIVGDLMVQDVELALPNADVAEMLAINERTPVLKFERRRTHLGRVFMIEDVFLRVDATAQDASAEQLEALAGRRWYGQDLATQKTESVGCEIANGRDVEIFGVSRLSAVLRLTRVIASYQGRPLELRYARCNLADDLHYASR